MSLMHIHIDRPKILQENNEEKELPSSILSIEEKKPSQTNKKEKLTEKTTLKKNYLF